MLADINKQVMESLADIMKMIKDAGKFVIDQMPSYIQQLISFYTANYIMWLSLFVILLIISLVWKKKAGDFSDMGPFEQVGIVFSFLGGVIGTVAILNYLLKIILAPKVWLVEYITNLIANTPK